MRNFARAVSLSVGLLVAAAPLEGVEVRGRIAGTDVRPSLAIAATPRSGDSVSAACEVGEERRFRCVLPSLQRADLRLEIAGAAPVHIWDADFAGGMLDLGELAFVPGASLAGWVAGDASDVDVGGAKVRLLRDDPTRPKGAEIGSAAISDRGFFQFKGIAAGAYVLVAERNGLSPARKSISLADSEARLLQAPLILQPLASLEVMVTPAAAPGGGPWEVMLSRLVPNATSLQRVARERASESGRWVREGLESGMYFVSIREGNTSFESRQIEVEPRMAPVFVYVSLVEVRGELRAGDEPLQARLTVFSREKGARTTIETDEEGRYRLFLPSEGTWEFDGELLPSRQSFRREANVRRRDGAEFARVDLTLPSGTIEGRVVDEGGEGVRAAVNLTRDGVPVSELMAGSDGRFELVGIEEGSALIRAFSEGRDSGDQAITVEDEGRFVTLVLRQEFTIAGTLRTRDGRPVPGASIRYRTDGIGMGLPAESTPRGMFELKVPAAARSVNLAIVSPSLPACLVTLPVDRAHRRLDVVIDPLGGDLIVRRNGGASWPVLFRDGAAANLGFLSHPRPGSGPPRSSAGGLAFSLEPGDYTLCPGVLRSDDCRMITIVPGGQTVVDATAWGSAR